MTQFVRIQNDNGAQSTVSAAFAASVGAKVLEGVKATNAGGRPLPATYPESAKTDGQPAGNASLEDWQAYARTKGATEEDLDDKGRDALRDEYGTTQA